MPVGQLTDHDVIYCLSGVYRYVSVYSPSVFRRNVSSTRQTQDTAKWTLKAKRMARTVHVHVPITRVRHTT